MVAHAFIFAIKIIRAYDVMDRERLLMKIGAVRLLGGNGEKRKT
jgi:hypothetical protein